MVWARTKLVLYDNIFEEGERDIAMSYSGKHPEKLYYKLKEIFLDVFNVPRNKIQEMHYNWEKKGDSDSIDVRWRVVKDMDMYSFLRFDISFKVKSTAGEGTASIRLKPRFITEYPQDTLIQQSIFYEMARRFWHNTFYQKQRLKWFHLGKELSARFDDAVKQYMDGLRQHG